MTNKDSTNSLIKGLKALGLWDPTTIISRYEQEKPVEALCAYIAIGDSENVQRMLDLGLASAHTPISTGYDAFGTAISHNQPECLEVILRHPKSKRGDWATALFEASQHFNSECSQVALKGVQPGDGLAYASFSRWCTDKTFPEELCRRMASKLNDHDLLRSLNSWKNPMISKTLKSEIAQRKATKLSTSMATLTLD